MDKHRLFIYRSPKEALKQAYTGHHKHTKSINCVKVAHNYRKHRNRRAPGTTGGRIPATDRQAGQGFNPANFGGEVNPQNSPKTKKTHER